MADAPVDLAQSDLVQGYDPVGAMGGMFAPALIRGYAPSEQAVAAWTAENHPVTGANVEQTRLPDVYRDPNQTGASDQYGGGRIPLNMNYGGPGTLDTEALRVMTQGGKYDWGARRDLIAQRMMANAAARGG